MKPFKSTLPKMYRPSKYKRPVYKNINPRRQRGENYVRYRLRLSIKRNLFLKIRTKNYSNLLAPKYNFAPAGFNSVYTYTLKHKITQKQQQIVLLLKRIQAKIHLNTKKKSIISIIQVFKKIVESLKTKKINYSSKYIFRLRKKRKFKKFTYKKIFKINNIKKHRNSELLKIINKNITYKNDLFLNETLSKNQSLSNLKNFKSSFTFHSKKLKTSKINKRFKFNLKFLNKKRFYFRYLNKKFQQLYKISKDLNIQNKLFIKGKFYTKPLISNQNNDILVQQSVENRIVNKKILANNIKNLIKNKRKFIRTVEKRITSDFKKRRVYLNFENNRLILKALIRNTKLSVKVRKNFYSKLLNFPKNSAKTRIRNRCVITGRGRAVYRDLKISRLMLRSLGNFGILPGISKSTW